MIYLVNGNKRHHNVYKFYADAAGLSFKAFANADDALDHLENATNIELVLVGNNLPTRAEDDLKGSRFSSEEQGAYSGHALIRKLIAARPDLSRPRIVSFEQSNSLEMARKTSGLVRDFGIVAAGSQVLYTDTLFKGPGWNVRNHLATLDARR